MGKVFHSVWSLIQISLHINKLWGEREKKRGRGQEMKGRFYLRASVIIL